MASCQTSQWVNTAPYVKLTVTESSSDGDSVVLSYTLQYIASSAANVSSARAYSISLAGSVVKSGTFAISGKTGTHTIASGTKEISKSDVAKSVSFSCSFAFNLTWSGSYKGTATASGSISVAAITTYSVSYNANGGSSAPGAQTKTYGKTLVLSSTKPTRTGYSFQGWATSASGSVAYASGANYTSNAGATLYAVWKANTYTVEYNANGGTNAPASQTKTYGQALTLTNSKPTRENYNFLGWGVAASSTTVAYASGASYTENAAATLYAVWQIAYIKPVITNYSVARCDEDGILTDEGTNALVEFDWSTFENVTEIKVEWSSSLGDSGIHIFNASGKSGSIGEPVGNNTLNVEATYSLKVTVKDSDSSNATRSLFGMNLPLDILAKGLGISFGKPAELKNTADFGYDAYFRKPVYGKALGMDKLPKIAPNSDLNDPLYLDPGCYSVQRNDDAATIANIPVARAGRLEVWSATGEGVRSEQWSYLRQRYIPYNVENATWERDVTRGSNNVWTFGKWHKSSLTPDASDYVYGAAEQSVLWGADKTSGMYMTAEHTITLSEPISAQRNGIVLVFCVYYSSTDTNYAHQSFFIPKQLVPLLSSKTHTFTLNRVTFGIVGAKQLTITDTKITGNDYNDDTGTQNGITFQNNKFVLRYVIGV